MIDKSELKTFGISNYRQRNEIYKIIEYLWMTYPIPKEDEGDGENEGCEGQVQTGGGYNGDNSGDNNIDSKYLCPITNKVMKDPVIAFDENCYERDAIIEYFRKCKQSPMTKEKIEDVEWVISLLVENYALKQEIEQKNQS